MAPLIVPNASHDQEISFFADAAPDESAALFYQALALLARTESHGSRENEHPTLPLQFGYRAIERKIVRGSIGLVRSSFGKLNASEPFQNSQKICCLIRIKYVVPQHHLQTLVQKVHHRVFEM
ncbi:hypothetical protein D9M68_978720 [compost metagenome]